MDKSQCFYLGEIRRTHGLKGELAAHIDADEPARYGAMDSVFLEQGGILVPYFIQKIQIRGSEAIITFEDLPAGEAPDLIGASLYLPLSLLPELTGNRFYYHEVPGYSVVDQTAGPIGTITRVLDLPRQAVLEVDFKGKEVLIPVTDHIIKSVDRDKKILHVDLPEGLLEIYTG